MADDETAALLQEVHAPWEFASHLETGVDPRTTVPELLAAQDGDSVITTLQNRGVSKLGEFWVDSDLAYPCFDGEPLLTLGCKERGVDFQRLWTRHLQESLPKRERPTGWSNKVVVEAFVVNVKGASNPDKDGLIQPLLKRYQAGALELACFGLPAVQACIEYKWHVFAKRLLMVQLALFIMWLASFFSFAILFQDEDTAASLVQVLETGRGQATVAAELIALLSMFPFLVLEIGTIGAYRSGWVNYWNGLDVSTYLLQIIIAYMHLTRHVSSGYLSIACALQCILLLFRLQYFSRVFTATRFAFLEAVKEAISSVFPYLAFMLLIMGGWAVAFHVLFRADQDHEEFKTITNSFLLMYTNQAGMLDLDLMRSSHNPVAATLLALLYAFCMGTVILNMLIGVMANALEKTGEHSGLKMILHKATIIDELEVTMPRWLESRFKGSWYPGWIHVLRVDLDRVDKPNLGTMWVDAGAAEGDGKAADTSGLEAKLAEMQSQLNRMEALLRAALPAASSAN